MSSPHFLVMPYPILGHINPLLQLSHVLAKRSCRITFLISEFSQKRVKTSNDGLLESQIKFVSFPDGLDPEDDRSDQYKVTLSLRRTMPPNLHKLVEDINASDCENKITCLIVSKNIGWALEVAHYLGIKCAFLWPASATSLASYESIQRLFDEGIIDSETGLPTRKQKIQLSPNSPMMDTANLPWCSLGKSYFHHMVEDTQTMRLLGEWWLCNTTYDLEPGALDISPRFLPIGPLMAISDTNNDGSFWQEDTTCLDWLDQQPPQSVIYVSFGSLAVVEPNQFKELALGLDLLNKPFLWVIGPSSDDNKEKNANPDELFNGLSKGKIVGWAPQKKLLNHPSIACFISHCGWNSTMEGVYGGVPFLCCPFFSDQFVNKSYICDVWKVGMVLDKDENGLVSREEIRNKVEQVLHDENMKARSLKLREMTMNNIADGGRSSKNLDKFINWAKD